jgi:branched-chain amino acid transport system ATP-binding protein
MTPVLRLNDVSKDFGGIHIIDDVDLEIVKGERHALIGPNGAGKSTLFNLITGLYSPTKGTIHFKDRRIDGLSPYRIVRLGIARSFQIINIFKDMKVYENVRNAVVARHHHSLAFTRTLVGLGKVKEETEYILNRIKLIPFQNEPAGTLGYGQQRALEMGLAIALDPDLVLLDEPGAGLTPEETRDVVKLIREVTTGKTLVIVEHDMDVVFDLADRISVLNRGRILATGTPDEIKKNETVREVYLGTWIEEQSHSGQAKC